MRYPIKPPKDGDYPEYFKRYISLVSGDDLIGYFQTQKETLGNFISSLPEDKLHYRYAEDKWTVLDVVQHIIDSERIFAYRALTFARADKAELPGFEENDYARIADTSKRTGESIRKEFEAVRNSTIALLESLDETAVNRRGTANGQSISVRAIGYIIAGHELHHVGVIKERYL